MAAPLSDAPGECEQQQQHQLTLPQTDGTRGDASYIAAAANSSADSIAYSGREGFAPVMVAAARVSARMVSPSGPVVTQHGLPQAATTIVTGNDGSTSSASARSSLLTSVGVGRARRGVRRGFSSSSNETRRDVLPSFQEAAVAAAARAQGSSRMGNKNEDGGDEREGDLQERDGGMERRRDLEEGEERGDHHPLAVQGSPSLRLGLGGGAGEDTAATGSVMEPNYSDGESSSPGSSESGGGSSSDGERISCCGCS